jgi:hypothetical protein
MGLTIHYNLKFKGTTTEAKKILEQLRQRAMDLPFHAVGSLIDRKDGDCNYDGAYEESLKWFLIQGEGMVTVGNLTYCVPAKRLMGFTILVGAGCEPMNVGFGQYPSFIVPDEKRIKTGYTSGVWYWGSFCKTQFASKEECGGIPNFLKCHLTVCKLLRYAKSLGVLEEVNDESDYWTSGDRLALANTVGKWNRGLAELLTAIKKAGCEPD